MTRRVLTLILTIALIGSYFEGVSYAAASKAESAAVASDSISEDEYQKDLNILKMCGLAMQVDENESVTNEKFALAIVQLLNINNDIYKNDAIAFLQKATIIPSDMRFLPETMISLEEAYVICVNALGYREKAQFTGYEKIVNEIDLDNNIKGSGKLTAKALTVLLYNALTAPLNEIQSISGTTVEYSQGESILNTYYDIYCVNEKILTTENAAVKGYENYIYEDCIYADGLKIKTNNTNIGEYCGYEAEMYVKKDTMGAYKVLLYYLTDTNHEKKGFIKDVIDVRGFNVGDSAQERKHPKISFYAEDKETDISVAENVTVIYNGAAAQTINNSDFLGETGTIRAIDCDNDGYYDIIYIKKYIVGRVNQIDVEENTILFDDGQKLYFDNADDVTVKEKKRLKTFYSIGNGTVICVYIAKSASANNQSEISIISSTIKGELTGLYTDENFLEVNGNRYAYNSELKSKLKLKNEYDFYIDDDGMVAYVKLSEENTQYAYFLDYEIDADTFNEKTVKIKLMFLGEKTEIYQLPKSIKYTGLDENGAWVDNFTVNSEKAEKIFNSNFTENQLIKVKIVDGIVSQIIASKDKSAIDGYKGYTDDEFTLEEVIGPEESEKLKQKTKISKKYNARPLTTLAIIDNVSDESDITFTEYTLGSIGIFSEESYCLKNAKIYDADKDNVIGVVVVQYDPEMTGYTVKSSNYLANGSKILVETVSEILDKNGDTSYLIKGYAGGWKVEVKAKNAEVTQKFNTVYANRNVCSVKDLACGDIIIPEFDKNGEMNGFDLILDKDAADPTSGNYLCYSGHKETQHTHIFNSVFGKVRRNFENKVLTIENVYNHKESPENPKLWVEDTNSYTKFLLKGIIYVCDQHRNKIFVASEGEYINDSLTGSPDTIFISRITQDTEFIVIYR